MCVHVDLTTFFLNTGFTDADNQRVFHLPYITRIGGNEKTLQLSDIVSRLQNVYCKHIGLEYMHINDRARCKLMHA